MATIAPPPLESRTWTTDKLSDEAVRAIQSCRKCGQAAAQHAWKAGAYLSLLHNRLVKGRKWAAWLRQHQDIITEDTARRYILLHERTGNRSKLEGLTLTEAYAAFGITRYIEVVSAEPGSNGRGPLSGFGGQDADHRRLPARTPPPSSSPAADRWYEPRRSLDPDDEEGILRAAAEIRQRRVAERLKEIQEKRQQARPVRIRKGSPVLHGDCLDLIPTLEDGSVSLVLTSPPYAEQRNGHYGGVSEEDYPDFTVSWMTALAQDDQGRLGPDRDPPAPAGRRPVGLRAADTPGAP